jgi:hypothetical protein
MFEEVEGVTIVFFLKPGDPEIVENFFQIAACIERSFSKID